MIRGNSYKTFPAVVCQGPIDSDPLQEGSVAILSNNYSVGPFIF